MTTFFIRELIGDYIDAKIAGRGCGPDLKNALWRAERRLDAALESLFTDGELRAASDAADKAGSEFDLEKSQ